MKRKRILLLQKENDTGMLDVKLNSLLPYIKNHYNTFVNNIRVSQNRPGDSSGKGLFSTTAKAKLILNSLKFDAVYVRNILDVNFLRGLRLLNHNLVLEISQPDGSALDLSENRGEKKNRNRKIVEKAAKVAKGVFVEGDHQKKILEKWNNKIGICPPVFPAKIYSRNESRPVEVVKTVGFAGMGSDCKALKSVEGALNRVSRRFPQILTIGTSDRFLLLEPPIKYVYRKIDTERISEIFSDTDIFIFPGNRLTNDFYGNSLFVLHALAARKPCIVWQTEIDGKIFRDGEDMFIVTCENEFVEKLSILIENRKLRQTMAEKGFEKAKKHFSPDVVADFYIDAFKKILDAH